MANKIANSQSVDVGGKTAEKSEPTANKPAFEEASSLFSAMKGGSYAAIMTKLYRLSRQVPSSISDIDPSLKELVSLDSKVARTYIQTKFYPSRLNDYVNNIIPGQLAALSGTSNNTRALKQNFTLQFQDLESQAKGRIEERAQLIKVMEEFMGWQEKKVTEVIREMAKGRPRSFVHSMIEDIEKRRKDIQGQAAKLNINEKSLQQKMRALENDIQRETSQISTPTGIAPQPSQPGNS